MTEVQEFGVYTLGLAIGVWLGWTFGKMHTEIKEMDRERVQGRGQG